MGPRSCWLLLCSVAWLGPACRAPAESPPRRLPDDVELAPEVRVLEGRVPPRATLAGLLRAHQVQDALVAAIVDRVREIFDPRRLRADQPYRLVRSLDGVFRRFEYDIDADRVLRVSLDGGNGSRVERRAPPTAPQPARLDVAVVPAEHARALVAVRGAIDRRRPSLVAALEAAGEGVPLAVALADIFSGEIDFTHDLQPGDRVDILFEKLLRDDEVVGYGAIIAAEVTNEGRPFRAFRYELPGKGPGYYDEQGRSLKRFMLSSPLPFEPRVTSRFSSRRLHPILGDHRAHLGVDYGAPPGTPVLAVASGVVVSAGWSGGSGRMVHLRHAGGYETFYLHLASIARGLRPGVRVVQGQLLGRVGASGLATGPHLDYRVRRHGVFVNPLAERRRLPPGEPVPPEFRAAFAAARDRARAWLFDTPPRVASRRGSSSQGSP